MIAVVNGEERLYSEKLACPNDGTSIPQLEPRSFSFNSPYGACEICNGVGSKWAFDPAKVIVDHSKPLFDGGLGPGATSSYMLGASERSLSRPWNQSFTPFEELPKKTRDVLLEGNGQLSGILNVSKKASLQASEGYREWLMDSCRRPSVPPVKVSG